MWNLRTTAGTSLPVVPEDVLEESDEMGGDSSLDSNSSELPYKSYGRNSNRERKNSLT